MTGTETELLARIKIKESEAHASRLYAAELEATRSISRIVLHSFSSKLANQLVALTAQNFQINVELKKIPLLEQHARESRHRYAAAVEVVAEKSLQVNDLQSDLADVKQIFKTQIQSLLDQIEQLKLKTK